MREKKILIDNLEVNYKIAGEGRPILILHGWGSSSHSWEDIQERLSLKGYKVICPDLPGFGKSQNPLNAWSVGDYSNWTLDFINHLKLGKFIIIAHSFGGRVAVKFSAYHPERLEKMVLCGSAGLKSKPGVKAGLIRIFAESGNVIFNLWALRIFKNLFKNIFYFFIRRYDYVKADGVMKETMVKVIEEDLFSCFSKIKTKTLLVWGEDDKMVPIKYAKIFHKNIKHSKLEIIPNVGHGPHLEVPEKLVDIIIKFLK